MWLFDVLSPLLIYVSSSDNDVFELVCDHRPSATLPESQWLYLYARLIYLFKFLHFSLPNFILLHPLLNVILHWKLLRRSLEYTLLIRRNFGFLLLPSATCVFLTLIRRWFLLCVLIIILGRVSRYLQEVKILVVYAFFYIVWRIGLQWEITTTLLHFWLFEWLSALVFLLMSYL